LTPPLAADTVTGRFVRPLQQVLGKDVKPHTAKSDACLLLTAAIWGFAFVAQRVGMAYVGPFTFNGIRFALGCLSLIPLLILTRSDTSRMDKTVPQPVPGLVLRAGGLAGFALFAGASLQQVGLVYTTAGKAGFITGLYVVIVPILGLMLGQRSSLESVFAALGGWLILEETLSPRGLIGCGLMFSGMLLSQLWGLLGKR
jgi:drug/metabolite transporter (DMT)-like permease